MNVVQKGVALIIDFDNCSIGSEYWYGSKLIISSVNSFGKKGHNVPI